MARIDALDVAAYEVPTGEPESDGTLTWDATTCIVVHVHAGGGVGMGYTYGPHAVATLIRTRLAPLLLGRSAADAGLLWRLMGAHLRNDGRPGVGMMAVAAVDIALWDLKGRLLDAPLIALLDAAHEAAPVYGSGGFTSAPPDAVAEQLGGWVAQGIPAVKMKVGRDPARDSLRLDAARKAIGDDAALLVDANGAYARKQALGWAQRLRHEWNVTWLEEPVSSADFAGLRLLRDRAPGGIEIAAGEYGFVLADFRNLLDAQAVDCLQADVTRCGGITGLREVAGLCSAHMIDLSAHTAPAISTHAFCSVQRLRHVEYFHDHVRVESLLFDGVPALRAGRLEPDRGAPGHGLSLKHQDAEPYRVA